MDGKHQACDLQDSILNLHFSSLMTINTWCHPHMGSRKYSFWCKPMERYLTTYRNTKHIYNGLVHKAQLTNAYRTTRSLDPTWYTICALWVDQLESNICPLSWSTSYLFFSLHYDDVLEVSMSAHTIFISSRHTCQRLNSHMTILRITPWIPLWP